MVELSGWVPTGTFKRFYQDSKRVVLYGDKPKNPLVSTFNSQSVYASSVNNKKHTPLFLYASRGHRFAADGRQLLTKFTEPRHTLLQYQIRYLPQ